MTSLATPDAVSAAKEEIAEEDMGGVPVHGGRWTRLAMALPGVLMVAFAYLPLLGLVVLSFSDRPMTGLPYPFTLSWYRELAASPRWLDPLLTSLLLATLTATACTALAVVVARAMPLLRYPGATLLLFLFPLFVPGMVIGVALLIYFRLVLSWRLGYWSLFAGHFIWAFPFALLTMLVVSLRFDKQLRDAAADLGASPWRVFWDVEVPLLRHGIIGAWIFAFLLSLNELPRSIQLRGATTTLPLFEWGQAAAQTSSIPYLFALSSIILLITLPAIFMLFRMLFRSGGSTP